MISRSFVAGTAIFLALAVGTGRAEPPSYWMQCYGGALDLSESTDPPYIVFNLPKPPSIFFSPGECRWPDRSFRPGEAGVDKGILVFKGTPYHESLPRLGPTPQPLTPKIPGADRAKEVAPMTKDIKKLLFEYARDSEVFEVRVFREELSGGRGQFVVIDVRRS